MPQVLGTNAFIEVQPSILINNRQDVATVCGSQPRSRSKTQVPVQVRPGKKMRKWYGTHDNLHQKLTKRITKRTRVESSRPTRWLGATSETYNKGLKLFGQRLGATSEAPNEFLFVVDEHGPHPRPTSSFLVHCKGRSHQGPRGIRDLDK